MNGYYLLILASNAAALSIPLVLFAALMRLVGRLGPRALAAILTADAVLWTIAAFKWYVVDGS